MGLRYDARGVADGEGERWRGVGNVGAVVSGVGNFQDTGWWQRPEPYLEAQFGGKEREEREGLWWWGCGERGLRGGDIG